MGSCSRAHRRASVAEREKEIAPGASLFIFASRICGILQPVDALFQFFADNFPDKRTLLLGTLPALLWAGGCLQFSAWLKRSKKWPTGYSRKMFHFLIFGTVSILHAAWGTAGVCFFGAFVSVLVAYAVLRGDGHPWYEALAREKDAPRRTYFVLAPYVATLIGGVFANIWFGEAALFGYLCAGLGDAIAEPVGVRWGKHPYRVPSLTSVPATRSLEGSAAVGLVCTLSVLAVACFHPGFAITPAILGIGVCCMLAEAVSPHGWDNAVLQWVGAGLGFWWLAM